MLKYTDDCESFIEPSAGGGVFLRDFTTHAFDLLPENAGVSQADWLTVDASSFNNACVYGNPPYGKRNHLSKAFIKKACEFSKVIAFILPAVYNKYTLQAVFPPEWKLVDKLCLPDKSFTECGKSYHIPSVFQVWVKGSSSKCMREIERLNLENKHFCFVKKGQGDLFIMGAAPHKLKNVGCVQPTNRGYWINCHTSVWLVQKNFKNIQWVGNSSASGGVSWFTKSEIINTYEENFNESK